MAEPHRPAEAVILFVQGPKETGQQGAIFKCHLLTGTYYCMANPSEMEFVQRLLTSRDIPWDNFGQATGDMLGFGVEVSRQAIADQVWQAPIHSFVSNDDQTAENMLGWTNQDAHEIRNAPK